jgi:PAS domain S-box-containing protein
MEGKREVAAVRAEEALRESEQKYRDIFERSVLGLFRTAPDGRLIEANDAFAGMYGYSSATEMLDVVQDVARHYANPEERQEVLRILLEKGIVENYESMHRKRDGTRFWVMITARTIRDTNGAVLFFEGLNTDITGRKRAEEALRENQTQLRAVLESTADGILAVDNKGKVLHANQRFAGLWRIPRSLMEGGDDRAMLDFVLDQLTDPGAFLNKVQALYDSDAVDSDILTFRDSRVFERYSLPMIMDGARIGRVWSFRDITERKRTEETIASTLAEKEVLLREIHHRVKNNLAGIISLIDLQIGSISDPVFISHLKDLETRIRSMALVHESLYQTKDLININIASYTENLARFLFQLFEPESGVRCRIEMGEITMAVETAIPFGLVMSEIVTNSLKHAFPKTFSCAEIRGEPCTIALTLHREGSDYLLKIADNGIGIPEGTGVTMPHSLGLFLIRFIVEHQLRGSVEVSTDGGTAYTIRFPEAAVKKRHAGE